MTHLEVKELFEKKSAEAKALIENTKNSSSLSVTPTLAYYDDELNESNSYDEKGETSIIADIEIRLAGRDGEDDPMISIGMLCDLKRGIVKSDEELEEETANFDKEISNFITKLSSAESVEDFITAESEKIDAENEKAVKELEEKLDKLTKYTKIGAFALIALAFLVALIKLLI
ncbi:MAG: hypothetical protein IJD79_06330 [Clostridia bacterium]|nr:hypothetical protein [Clostridia bacterium]